MPKCNECRACTGLVTDGYVECTGTCAVCGAHEKEAGMFRRSDKELWCTAEFECRDRLMKKTFTPES